MAQTMVHPVATTEPAQGTPQVAGPRVRRGFHKSSRRRQVVALCRGRLGRAWGTRIGRLAAFVILVGFATNIFIKSSNHGDVADLSHLITQLAIWLTWLGAGPVALSAAGPRAVLDAREGIDTLAAMRGTSGRDLANARTVAAMITVATTIALPVVLLGGLATALSGSADVALARVAALTGATVFALVAGISIGGLAATCGRIARDRGRALFVAVVILPWMVADLLGHPTISLPGALWALLTVATDAAQGSM